ncbi:hypothetical protein [Paenibacillus woosongensis]|uniref:hypothetical protein n=1 Tax=Paenibacillus woosongensis TaxID=307580 RepID=UPI0012D9A3E3|nr:hypothetical protein [Paenibacillus woosongensis]
MKKDSTFRSISLIFLIAGMVLPLWIGAKTGFEISSPWQPLITAIPLSLFLYFIIPIHVCFFATEGFEYGSVKIIIASGKSRSSYFIGKYITEITVILFWIFQFFFIYYVISIVASLLAGTHIRTDDVRGDLITAITAIGFNVLYLMAYSAIVMMVGIFTKKSASTVIITFLIIFIDFILSGYLKDSSLPFLRMVSNNTLMTQIMKFNGLYIFNSQQILLSGLNDYFRVAIIPIIIVFICLTITLISFEKSDIHT